MTVRRERLLVYIAVVLIVLYRSAMFVFNPTLNLDSDEAIVGLMAKHLSQGRAFPLFYYGQNYMLGVEAWLAAPVFLVMGASVTALTLPLLAINLVTGLLLVILLEREAGLRPIFALVASLFFLLPPPGAVSLLLGAIGGNVEPFLYALLLWITRRRPLWFGFILGVGFLQREATIYAAIAVIVIELAEGAWRRAERRQALLSVLTVAAAVWLVVQVLRPIASAAGPGTTAADIAGAPGNNVIEVFRRLCFDWRTVFEGIRKLVTVQWAHLFGIEPGYGYSYGLESAVPLGLSGGGFVFGAAALVLLARIAWHARRLGGRWEQYRFCVYLTLVGAFSAGVYAVGRCGAESALRYDLLSLLGAVGLAAWFFAAEPHVWWRRVGVAIILGWALLSAVPHARIWAEYTTHAPVAAKAMIIRSLDARGIKYATSDYWIAYYITFLTDERIIVTPTAFVRIPEYERVVNAHRAEAVHIARQPCAGGTRAVEGVYLCPIE